MDLTEKITLINLLAITRHPSRKLIVFVGREQVIGFEIVKNGTFDGRTYMGDLVTLTLSEELYCNTNRKIAFEEQLIVSSESSPFMWVRDVEGNNHPIFVCYVNRVPNAVLIDLIKGN